MINKKDIENLKELVRYANPWDNLRVDLRCGEESRNMVHSTERIIKYLRQALNSLKKEDKPPLDPSQKTPFWQDPNYKEVDYLDSFVYKYYKYNHLYASFEVISLTKDADKEASVIIKFFMGGYKIIKNSTKYSEKELITKIM